VRSTPIARAFFERPADVVAPALLGCVIVRTIGGAVRRARVCETEAYLGPVDLASHASRGRTPRTEVMFGPPGFAYVYLIYGMHWMLNVTCGSAGGAHAVLLRGARPLEGWPDDAQRDLAGPGRLARAFGVTRADYGIDLCEGPITFESDPCSRPIVRVTPRINVDYAGEWAPRELRYVDGSG
jgi:DNA-3-methyladenine glycosylase